MTGTTTIRERRRTRKRLRRAGHREIILQVLDDRPTEREVEDWKEEQREIAELFESFQRWEDDYYERERREWERQLTREVAASEFVHPITCKCPMCDDDAWNEMWDRNIALREHDQT